MPPWSLCLLCLSKRLHSIYLLRLFNDGLAMFVAYVALLALIQSSPRLSVTLFSLAVSIKMNVLLMAPSVFILLLQVTHIHLSTLHSTETSAEHNRQRLSGSFFSRLAWE